MAHVDLDVFFSPFIMTIYDEPLLYASWPVSTLPSPAVQPSSTLPVMLHVAPRWTRYSRLLYTPPLSILYLAVLAQPWKVACPRDCGLNLNPATALP